MRTIIGCLLLAVLPVAAGAKTWPEAARVAAKDINVFAFDLYARLAAENAGNVSVSPYSISTALAMTYAGARGGTEAQMARVLRFSLGQDRLHAAYLALAGSLAFTARDHGYELNIANRLWAQEGYPFLAAFLDGVKENYRAEAARADFVRSAEAARVEINQWVERQTKDRIRDLLARGVLDSSTALVLVNAIYFKGSWEEQFAKEATSEEPFRLAGGTETEVPMMHRTGKYRYAEDESVQALELPYKGGGFSMVVLLPRDTDGLARLEERMSAAALDGLLAGARRRDVRVALPRFRAESAFSLKDTLGAMGMTDAFTGAADFTGMAERKGLFISAVVHKAFVEVNEEGTEAAAATAVMMMPASAPPPPVVFRADHPFLFLVRDAASGCILFMGRVANPGG